MKTGKIKNGIFVFIRIVMVAALVLAIAYFGFIKKEEVKKSFKEVAGELEKVLEGEAYAEELQYMQKSEERFFKKYYDLNGADYEGVLLYAPISNMDAHELLLVKVKNPAQMEELTKAVQKRQATKEGIFEGYAPEQYEQCQNFILEEKGDFLIFIVAKDPWKIYQEYLSIIK